jgi:hypothetical protein
MVGGSVDSERTFSFMKLVTGDQCNSLAAYLALYERQLFTIAAFP